MICKVRQLSCDTNHGFSPSASYSIEHKIVSQMQNFFLTQITQTLCDIISIGKVPMTTQFRASLENRFIEICVLIPVSFMREQQRGALSFEHLLLLNGKGRGGSGCGCLPCQWRMVDPHLYIVHGQPCMLGAHTHACCHVTLNTSTSQWTALQVNGCACLKERSMKRRSLLSFSTCYIPQPSSKVCVISDMQEDLKYYVNYYCNKC